MAGSQAAWVQFSQAAVPRPNHFLRVLPTSHSMRFPQVHAGLVWQAFCAMLAAEEHKQDVRARDVATFPASLGGLSSRSARRTVECAFGGIWVDAFLVLVSRSLGFTAKASVDLERAPEPAAACFREVQAVRASLSQPGAIALPTWREALQGPKFLQFPAVDDVEYAQGWRWHARSIRGIYLLEHVVLLSAGPVQRATLLSRGGGRRGGAGGGVWSRAIPSEHSLRMQPLCFQVAMRRRFRWFPMCLAMGREEGFATFFGTELEITHFRAIEVVP